MRIIMIVATSKDWFITDKNGSFESWTSPEDKVHFSKMASKFKFGVKGINTHLANSSGLNPNHFRVVLTHSPEKYTDQTVPGVLEFHELTPIKFVEKYADQPTCLLLGGSSLFTSFLKANLVDEIYLTTEPIQLHEGIPVLKKPHKLADFTKSKPVATTKLNDSGTLLQHYVLKN